MRFVDKRPPSSGVVARRVGLVGCGLWGRNILRDLLLEGAEVTVVDPDPSARSQAVAAGARASLAELDGLREVDGLVVATPASTHGGCKPAAHP
jgi:prephenate dehydrogenase